MTHILKQGRAHQNYQLKIKMKILYQDILYPLILGPFPKLNCYLPQAKDDTIFVLSMSLIKNCLFAILFVWLMVP